MPFVFLKKKCAVRVAVALYLIAGLLLLLTRWPGPIAAVLVLPYAINALPWWNVTDGDAQTANRGWRRFLWLNFISGFVVTMLLIWSVLLRG